MDSLMDSILILILFSSISPAIQAYGIQASEADCPTTRCSHDGPDIRFPFRAKDQQPQHCGYPGFELVCKGNDTVLEFPSLGELIVTSISYNPNKLNLFDPKNCVSDVFLNLNLSNTPFQYFFVVSKYTYINCSREIPHTLDPISNHFLEQVPCQSSPDHHIYMIEPSFTSVELPAFCSLVKTVAIPFAYSPYLYGDSFGLALTWDLPGCKGCEEKGGWCGFKTKTDHEMQCFNSVHHEGFIMEYFILVLSMGFFILIVLMLASAKVYYSWKLHREEDIENQKKDNPCTLKTASVENLAPIWAGKVKYISVPGNHLTFSK